MDTNKKEALEPWRPQIIINDDRYRPISSYRFDGLTPLSHYEVQITVENRQGVSETSRFVFRTSEGSLNEKKSLKREFFVGFRVNF